MTRKLTIEDVDQAVEGLTVLPGRLRFSPRLEQRFERDEARQRCLGLAWRGLIGALFFLTFLVADWTLTPDVFGSALVLRLGVSLPLSLAAVLLLRTVPGVFLREGLVALIGFTVANNSLVLMILSEAPQRAHQQDSAILIILFLTVFARQRFPFAALSTALILVGMVSATLVLPDHNATRPVSDLINLVLEASLSLFAGYALEREFRRSYLLSLREQLRGNRLEDQLLHDPLTGLENRWALERLLDDLMEETAQAAVIVVDIDHFKSYNDTLGHLAGDVALKRVAGILAGQLRAPADRAVRFGGEEFVVVLPATELRDAVLIAERMRREVEAAAIPHPARRNAPVLTASFGVAAGRLGPAVSGQDLIGSADAALYTAKAAGRNQVWPRPRRAAVLVDRQAQWSASA